MEFYVINKSDVPVDGPYNSVKEAAAASGRWEKFYPKEWYGTTSRTKLGLDFKKDYAGNDRLNAYLCQAQEDARQMADLRREMGDTEQPPLPF